MPRVAAALGMGALHVGTDGGGSIRIPASFCGIVGLKPTFGRVPAWPLSPFGTVAHLGPMTRTVEDAALMLTVISRPGHPRLDTRCRPTARTTASGSSGGIAGLRIAASPTLGFVEVAPGGGARRSSAALAVLADLGARVELVDPPVGRPGSIFARTWFPAAARLLEKLPAEMRARGSIPGFVAMAEQGARYSRAEIQDAMLERGELGVAMQGFLAEYDLLVTPSTALPAFAAGVEHPDPERPERWSDWASFSYPFNLTQQPAISRACGLHRATGCRSACSSSRAKYADALVLRAARAFEAACPQPMPEAPRGAVGLTWHPAACLARAQQRRSRRAE